MAPPLRAPSPTPTVFQTPQQRTTRAAEDEPPPVAEVAAESLRLAFHTPSGSTRTLQSSPASSTTETEAFDGETIAAASIAAASAVEDSSLRLPSYLTRLAGRQDHGVNLTNVFEEAAEVGDGGDSDAEGDDARDHDVALTASLFDRMSLLEETAAVEDAIDNSVVLASAGRLSTAPSREIHVNIPDTPTDWQPPTQKVDKGEPAFVEVDNPGGWSQFVFRPEFGTTAPKQYKRHSMPTGAQPVPVNPDGKRIVDDWEFFYNGWDEGGDGNGGREGATSEDMFPESRKGELDGNLLETLGLTKERMVDGDALFFHQLLLPMCDPKMSGIAADPRKAFYSQVETFSNLYAIHIGLGGSYGHKFKNIVLDELVHFDGVVIRDGVKGGSNGAIYRRWMDGADYDALVQGSITHTRWLQIKRVMKLNNNQTSPKRGEEGYDPAFKFDMLYDVLISNLNAVTKYAESDQCGDETTWGHGGYGEAGSGLAGRIMGKPGITRGGQIVIISDVSRCRPRAYVHRHKLHERPR
jgi:hypothetical protein